MRCAMRNRQLGMSLVEVVVAVAIGLIGILIITQAYLTSDRFNRSTMGEGSAQTNGTIALFTIEREVRQAGYGIADSRSLGCTINWYYDPNYSANLGGTLPNLTLAPVVITQTPGAPDSISVMYSSEATRLAAGTLTKTMPAPSSELDVDGTYGYSIGDKILLVSNTTPTVCTLEQITTLQPSAAKMQHNPGGTAPYNPSGGGLFPAYGKDSLVFDMGNPIVHTYQIGNGNLQLADTMLIAGGGTPTDVVADIIDLRAQYGKDNGVNNGTVSNTIYAANNGIIDSFDNTQPATAAEWTQVLAVRVAVLARINNYEKPSVSGGNCDATTVMPTWSGSATDPFTAINIASVTSQDRCFRYRVFETTVPLRNMIWRAS